jgi:hypothetical protein
MATETDSAAAILAAMTQVYRMPFAFSNDRFYRLRESY